jgi:spore coat protein U-like protein
MTRFAVPLLLATIAAFAPPARGASCQISATDLAFGTYRFNSDVDVLGTVTIAIQNCAPDLDGVDVSYTIAIGPGGSGSFVDRVMSGFSGALHYNVYTDASHTLVWGDGSAGTAEVSGSFTVPLQTSASHTAHARIPAGQTDLSPGSYADQLTITINY